MALFNEKKRFLPLGILGSLWIAFKNLFRRSITIQYPRQRAYIPGRARWAVQIREHNEAGESGPWASQVLPVLSENSPLDYSPGVRTHHCTACQICEKQCPDYLIRLDVETLEDRSKVIKHWWYDRDGCMMCGLCVEACPFDAIEMGHDYELAHADPDLRTLDLLSGVVAWKRPERPAPSRPAGAAAATGAAGGAAKLDTSAKSEATDA